MSDEPVALTLNAYQVLNINEKASDNDIYQAYQHAIKTGIAHAQVAYNAIANAQLRERYRLTFLPCPKAINDIITMRKRQLNHVGPALWLKSINAKP